MDSSGLVSVPISYPLNCNIIQILHDLETWKHKHVVLHWYSWNWYLVHVTALSVVAKQMIKKNNDISMEVSNRAPLLPYTRHINVHFPFLGKPCILIIMITISVYDHRGRGSGNWNRSGPPIKTFLNITIFIKICIFYIFCLVVAV